MAACLNNLTAPPSWEFADQGSGAVTAPVLLAACLHGLQADDEVVQQELSFVLARLCVARASALHGDGRFASDDAGDATQSLMSDVLSGQLAAVTTALLSLFRCGYHHRPCMRAAQL